MVEVVEVVWEGGMKGGGYGPVVEEEGWSLSSNNCFISVCNSWSLAYEM